MSSPSAVALAWWGQGPKAWGRQDENQAPARGEGRVGKGHQHSASSAHTAGSKGRGALSSGACSRSLPPRRATETSHTRSLIPALLSRALPSRGGQTQPIRNPLSSPEGVGVGSHHRDTVPGYQRPSVSGWAAQPRPYLGGKGDILLGEGGLGGATE